MPSNSKYEKRNEKHEELKVLSDYVYQDGNKKPYDWNTVQVNQNPDNGFYAEVMTKGDDVAVVIRGTDKWSAADIASDLTMKESHLPSQVIDAKDLYNQVQSEYPDKNIVVTGHSLGGSVAQAVGAETGAETVTFNAYGVGDAMTNPQNTDNITNYGNSKDPVFLSNINNQIGKTYVTNDYENNNGYIDKKLGVNKDVDYSLEAHKLKNMGDLSQAIEYDKNATPGTTTLKGSVEYNEPSPYTRQEIANMTLEEFAKNEDEIMRQLANGQIKDSQPNYSGYQNSTSGNGKIYTREEIGKMSPEEFAKNEKAIENQMKTVGIPFENELENNQTDANQNSSGTVNQSSKNEPWAKKPDIVKTNSANDDNVVGYVWVASSGSCEACQDLDGQTFESEDDIPEIPHPNCNCTVERIIKPQENGDDDSDDDEGDEDDYNNKPSNYKRSRYDNSNPLLFNFLNNF